MPKLDSFRFANRQEVRRVQIDKAHLFEIQHEPLRVPINLCLQLLYLFRMNSAAELENGFRSIRDFLDLQNHLRISPGYNAAKGPIASY